MNGLADPTSWSKPVEQYAPEARMKAVLVYLAERLGRIIRDISDAHRIDIKRAIVAGGLSLSDAFLSIASSTWGVEVLRPATIEASSLGAATIGFRSLGLLRSDQLLFDA